MVRVETAPLLFCLCVSGPMSVPFAAATVGRRERQEIHVVT